DDLSAFLEKRPVVARPPSFSYLAWRFTQRHRVAVSAGVAVLLSILAALAVSVTMYFREREARRRADLETAKTRQVARFLEDTLAAAGPEVAMGRDATLMKEVLRKTTDRLDTELGGQPEIEAEIRLIVGRTWKSLVEDTLAEEQIGRALALLRELHPGDHPDLARGIADHAEALIGLNRFRDAEPVAREGLEMWERLEGADHPEAGLSLNQIAFCLVKTGRPAEAEPIARRAYDLWRARPAESALEEAPNVYAIALMNQGRRDEAIGIYREQLAADRENLGAEHPQVVNILDNLGCTLAGARRDEEAEPILLEGVAMGRKFYEDRCPFEDHMLAALAGIAGRKGDLDGQLRYSREGAAVGARVYPPGHGYFLESQGQLARTLMAQAETRLDRAWTAKDEGEREKAKALLAELRNTEAFARIVKAEAAWIAALEALAARTEDAAEKLEIASARWKPNDPRAKRREVWLERLTQQG
ncbi:MAG: tetratricopeptide repeat protein, partial [Verrucomicrobiae bacterium]|nr:tetratricopeptide repeat protein [Verrucomicrobiae bacterium]